MPESRAEALKRAKKEGFPASSVKCADRAGKHCYILPHGIEEASAAAKQAYVDSRERGLSSESAAKVAWTVQRKVEEARKKG